MSYKAPTYQQIDNDPFASHITPVIIITITIAAAISAIVVGCTEITP